MLARDRIHDCTVAITLVGEVEQRPDLLDGEAQVARAPDEAEAGDMRAVVGPVIAGRSRGSGIRPIRS